MKDKKYLPSVTLIRGIAALAVCLFHFSADFLAKMASYNILLPHAWSGVEIFFVISGFVIPYSLLSDSAENISYGKYFLKRIIRIEPSYLASILMIIVLNYISTLFPIYKGDPFSISSENMLLHLGYLVDFFDGIWLNPVYWTLAIELQYYFIIGLLLVLWNYNNKFLTIATFLLFLSLSFFSDSQTFFLRYTDIFSIGIICAFYKRDYINKSIFLIGTLIIATIMYVHHGMAIVGLSVLAVLGIAFVKKIKIYPPLLFFGKISFSLYLLHVPIGGRIVNLSRRLDLNEWQKSLVILVALLISICAAYVFYILVEKPSHRWARSIKVKRIKDKDFKTA